MAKKKKKKPTYNMTWDQIETIKKDAKKEGMNFAFEMMVALPLLVLRDQFGFGKVRLQRFAESLSELTVDMNEERLDLYDIADTLSEETGLTFSWSK